MNTLCRPAKRLTFLQRRTFLPHFSPDGTKVIFTACGGGRCDIYIMNADGSDLKPLTTEDGQFSDPVFSPDGTQVAFIAAHPVYEEIHDIHLMNADGTEQRALTATHKDSYPTFSPDGQHIAFTSGRDGQLEIYQMKTDGTALQRLTSAEDKPDKRIGPGPKNLFPIYSPDGKWIVFVSVPIGPSRNPDHVGRYSRQPSQLHCMRSDGADRKPLVILQGDCDEPMFSPDGGWLAFRNWRALGDCTSSICLTRPDGSGLLRLPESHGVWASFHPEGNCIIFASGRDRKSEEASRNRDIYCIGIEEGAIQRLTNNEADDNCPIFSPDGKQIVFCSNRDGFEEIYTMPYES